LLHFPRLENAALARSSLAFFTADHGGGRSTFPVDENANAA
jgi:hypothetical protein